MGEDSAGGWSGAQWGGAPGFIVLDLDALSALELLDPGESSGQATRFSLELERLMMMRLLFFCLRCRAGAKLRTMTFLACLCLGM